MNRVWTYIISKTLNAEELNQLSADGKSFVESWKAHENQLSASFEILQGKIIVVKVNEDVNNASGCSIDKLLRFVKDSEQKFNMELLNRLLVAYKNQNQIEIVHSSKIKDVLAKGSITEDTIILNTSVANEQEFNNWEQPLKDTWLNKYLVKA